MVELSRRIQLRDPEAVKEMEGLRKAQTTAKALRTQAMTMEPGADQDALVRQADLLDSGMLIEDAKAIATAAVAPKKKKEDDAAAVKRKGEEAKAEYENKVGPEVKARGQAAIALEKEQQTGRMAVEEAETERAVKVAGIGAASHERVAKLNAAVEMAKESARKSERLDEKGKARLAAQNNLLRVESAVAGQYVRLASDPMSAESRALRATKTDAEREMLKRQYVASDPAVIQALANLEEYGGVPQPKGKEGAIQAVSTHGGKAKADPLGLR
jgi:autonomous glycyl radical cofactor GrcA